jgi:(S)-ureidoglycine aminohydrolase
MLPPGILSNSRTRVKNYYAMLPSIGIVESILPNFKNTIARVQVSSAIGAQFAQILLELGKGAVTIDPIESDLEHFFFVLEGAISIEYQGDNEQLIDGGFAYLPPGSSTTISNQIADTSRVIWVKRRHIPINTPAPKPLFGNQKNLELVAADVKGSYSQLLLPYDDIAFDFGMSILHFEPGVYFDYVETHVMEHSIYMLAGQGLYFLGDDLIEVQATDVMYVAPYCPQFYFSTGWKNSSYLIYKNINRNIPIPNFDT